MKSLGDVFHVTLNLRTQTLLKPRKAQKQWRTPVSCLCRYIFLIYLVCGSKACFWQNIDAITENAEVTCARQLAADTVTLLLLCCFWSYLHFLLLGHSFQPAVNFFYLVQKRKGKIFAFCVETLSCKQGLWCSSIGQSILLFIGVVVVLTIGHIMHTKLI